MRSIFLSLLLLLLPLGGTTLAGTFSGLLRLGINKRDVDLGVVLYALTSEGETCTCLVFWAAPATRRT